MKECSTAEEIMQAIESKSKEEADLVAVILNMRRPQQWRNI